VSGGGGLAYKRQWGSRLYLTTHATAGFSAYHTRGPESSDYIALGLLLKPQAAIGLALPRGITVEAGPAAWIAPPLFQAYRGVRPNGGLFTGHIGLEVTVLAGNASPTR